MLECRLYQYEELSKYLKTTNPQGTERKLENYGVEFSKRGVGTRSSYNITVINEPFKVFGRFIGTVSTKAMILAQPSNQCILRFYA